MASSAGPQLPAGEETNNNRPIGAISSDTLGALYLCQIPDTLRVITLCSGPLLAKEAFKERRVIALTFDALCLGFCAVP